MNSIHIVESDFQEELAMIHSKNDMILYLSRNIILRILQLPFFLLYLLISRKRIIIYDYRSIILVLLVFFKNKNLLVGDDGLHSLLVEKSGTEFLYRSCNPLKKFLMKLNQKKILNLEKFSSIDYFIQHLINQKISSHQPSKKIFIDQPMISNITDYDYVIKNLELDKDIWIAVHPRSKRDWSMFDKKLKIQFKKNLIIENNHFFGYYSTFLLFATALNRNVTLFEIDKINGNKKEVNYSKACQKIILDYKNLY